MVLQKVHKEIVN